MEIKKPDKILLKKIFIFLLAFIGFLTTIKLALVYYDANFNKYAMPSFCSINEFIDCDGIAKTVHSQFLGIPLAYWGMFLYIFVFFLVFVDKLKKIKYLGFLEVFKNPIAYIAALGFISFVISMILAGVSLFQIKKICLLCVFTYFINLAIALVAIDFSEGYVGILNIFKTSVKDFIDGLKVKKYLISFIILLCLAIAVLADTSLTYRFTPQVKLHNSLLKYVEMKTNPYKVTGNVLGDKDAKTIVYLYTDYRCPICRVYNIITHKAVKDLGGFKIVHKNFPLDTECNRYVLAGFHEGACMLAKYSIAAEDQGHFWDINSAFFDEKPKTEEDVLKLAASMGLDTERLKKDANSLETSIRINKDIDDAMKHNIDGTPALVIKETVYIGLKPYDELKNILIKVGAFERK